MKELLPLWQLIYAVIRAYPGMFANPVIDFMYLVVLTLVGVQYSRAQITEERLYGRARNSAFGHTVTSIGLGLLGGLVASVLMVVTGVTLTGSGVGYLLPIAMLLFLVSPRFLCYSYAGALASISFLLFGWPKVNVPAIMGLVACLHAVEALLIWIGGASFTTPLFMRHKDGSTVGGFALQRYWPIPLIALLLVKVPDVSGLKDVIHLPDWWPLLRVPEIQGPGDPVFAMMPVVAALGYTDLAISSYPQYKARVTSKRLAAFSAILLMLSIAASRWPAFIWLAPIFSVVGHEACIRMGLRDESRGEPLWVNPESGLLVMDVLPASPAEQAGLRPGDVVRTVNGSELRSKSELAVSEEGAVLSISREGRSLELWLPAVSEANLGVVFAPSANEENLVIPSHDGVILRFVKGLLGQRR